METRLENSRVAHRIIGIVFSLILILGFGCGKKDRTAELSKKLCDAVSKGYLVEVQKLTREYPKLAKIPSDDAMSSTPLHLAVNKNRLEIARTLLENGADINAQNKHGQTPLILAAMSGHVEIAQMLLSRNARKDVRDHWGQSALMYATKRRHPDIAKLLK